MLFRSASNTCLKPRSNGDEGVLLKYGYNGFVYDGNLDGKTVVYYNPSPSTVRFTGVSLDKGKTFLDIPKGTTWPQLQQMVEDYKNPKPKAVKTAKATNVGSSRRGRTLVSPYMLKWLDKPKYKAIRDALEEINNRFVNGDTVTPEQIIFAESWYIRFGNRARVYPDMGSIKSETLMAASYIAAYACRDAVAPLDIFTSLSSCVEESRMANLLLSCSIKIPLPFRSWAVAFNMFGMVDSFRPIIPSGKGCHPVFHLARFISGCLYCNHTMSLDLFRHWDDFEAAYRRDFTSSIQDALDEINSLVPEPFGIFAATRDTYDISREIESISTNGIVYK